MPLKYLEYMHKRISGKEGRLPLFLDHKIDANAYFVAAGIPSPELYAAFDKPSKIQLDGFPDLFVIKPAYGSSSKGVQIIERLDGKLFDRMSKTFITLPEIIAIHSELYEKHSGVRRRVTIVEELVIDSNGVPLAEDYKFMTFQGKIGLIIKVNRMADKLSMSFFDGEFRPIYDDQIIPNKFYSHVGISQTPVNWRSLLDVASRVSTIVDTPFARVDLYDSTRGPLVGEVTLTPSSFYFEYDHQLSDELNIDFGLMWARAERRLGR